MNRCVIYDFETLGLNTTKGVVLSMAVLEFYEDRYTTKPYTYEELLASCHMIKFDVKEQIQEYKRVVDPDTIKWWSEQSKEAQTVLKPSAEDKSISELYKFITNAIPDCKNLNKAYTRGNTFDPMFLENIMRQTNNPDPFHWRIVRDTRSMIEGMSWGANIDNGFVPEGLLEKFIAHDPRHDVVMDVMRMQTIASALG